MSFHGIEVKTGKPSTFVPPPEETALFIKQAALLPSAPKGAEASLMVKSGTMDTPFCLGTLSKRGVAQMQLDFVLKEYAEFSVEGNASIHVTGVMMEDGDDDVGDLDVAGLEGLRAMQFGEDSDDEDDDDYNESDDSDIPRLEDLSAEEEPVKKNGATKKKKKNQPIVEEPSDSSDDDDDDDDDDSDEGAMVAADIPSPQPKKEQQSKKMKNKQNEPVPSPEAKEGKTKKMAVKREAEEMVSPAPKRSKDAGKKDSEPKAVASPGSTEAPSPTPTLSPLPNKKKKHTRRFKNGFVIHNSKYGPPDGKISRKGKTLVVSYVGKLENGKVFDKTKGKSTFSFVLGAGQVVKGWDKGLEDMRVGDVRQLTVPPSMGYGANGSPPAIPPNATLMFDVTLENVK